MPKRTEVISGSATNQSAFLRDPLATYSEPPSLAVLCQVLHEGWRPVSLSVLDKALQIEVDDTQTRATSRKGYRMV